MNSFRNLDRLDEIIDSAEELGLSLSRASSLVVIEHSEPSEAEQARRQREYENQLLRSDAN